MDTLETYIRMADCEEIQGLRPEDTDEFSCEFLGGIWVERFNKASHNYDEKPPNIAPSYWIMDNVWLPRQDQLQEMVKRDSLHLILDFECFAISYGDLSTSMEQLWLAFVMKEKYNKTWDGGKWVVVRVQV
ncbi:hypothetical protein LCGC14_1981920 [marine sediment metagenome]|uniref:Uncharacterized protein n=1 Tax=marine sediment metagenome TaxID=412755 RepID=A0A0F9F8J6_9ZZZZ